jgi:hypothetical protein
MFMAGKCIFCGETEAKITREHIWADWLTSYVTKDLLNYEAGKITVNLPGLPSSESSRLIGGDPKSRRVKCVCVHCNTGWMREIQDQAKPIIVPMLKGEALTLYAKQRNIIAAWIAMAVMCSEFGKDSLRAISQADRDYLHNHKIPPLKNWRIWIGHYHRGVSHTQWDRRALLILPKKEVAQARAAAAVSLAHNTQSTTYTVGEVLIHAISSEWDKCVRLFHITPPDLLLDLWPVRGRALIWPPAITFGDPQAAQIAAGFFDGLQRGGRR